MTGSTHAGTEGKEMEWEGYDPLQGEGGGGLGLKDTRGKRGSRMRECAGCRRKKENVCVCIIDIRMERVVVGRLGTYEKKKKKKRKEKGRT